MTSFLPGYGLDEYGIQPYGSIRHAELLHDLVLEFFEPYYPTGGFDIANKIPQIWNAFEDMKAETYRRYTAYRKVFIRNSSIRARADNVQVSIIAETNPYTFISIASEKLGASLPADSNDINVSGGSGPDTFDVLPVNFGSLVVNDAKPIWIRLFVYLTESKAIYAGVRLKITASVLETI